MTLGTYDVARSAGLLAQLERRGLDRVSVLQNANPANLISRRPWRPTDLQFHRIRSVVRRSDMTGPKQKELLGLLAVLAGSSAPLVLVLLCRDGGAALFVGSATTKVSQDTLRASVHGCFPSAGIHPHRGDQLADALQGFRLCVVLTGASPMGSPGVLAQVVGGLQGATGAVIAVALPVRRDALAATRDKLLAEIIAVSPFLKLNQALQQRSRETITTEHPNPALERYVRGLEQYLHEIDSSADAGLWRVSLAIAANDTPSLSLLRALSCSAWSTSDKHTPVEPLRVLDCASPHLRQAVLECLPFSPLQLPGEAAGAPVLSSLFGGAVTPMAAQRFAALCAFPSEEYPGFGVSNRPRFQVDPQVAAKPTLTLGVITDLGRETGLECRVSRQELCKHALIAGVTGSGKTTTCITFLRQLATESPQVPCLVIEPAKREYRRIIGSTGLTDAVVFTLGEETAAPIRLNPFEVEPGASVQAHLDLLRAAFQAAFPMYPPMPQVLERCLHEVYSDHGWDLIRNERRGGLGTPDDFPTLSDLFAKIGPVVDAMGYDVRITQDVKAAMRARIGSLRLGGKGSLLDCWKSTPMAEILKRPVVLELEAIADDEEKAFVLGLLLVRLYEHRIAAARQGDLRAELRHVTLFEEAHRLLARTSDHSGNPDAVNTKAKAVEVFANVLSEIRAYGEAIVVAEQIPTKLASDVIKNTNIKVAHRLVAEEDRDLVGTSMRTSAAQREDLAVLGTGEAAVFCAGFNGPYLVRVIPDVPQPGADDAAVMAAYRSWRLPHEATFGKYAACCQCPAKCLNSDHAAHIGSQPGVGRVLEAALGALAVDADAFEHLYRSLRARVSRIDPQLGSDAGRLEDVLGCLFVNLGERRLRWPGASKGDSARDPELLERYRDFVSSLFADRGKPCLGVQTTKAARIFGERYRLFREAHTGPFEGCQAVCSHRCVLRFAGAALAADDTLMQNATAVYIEDGADRFSNTRKVVESSIGIMTGASESVAMPLAACTFVQICARAGLADDDAQWAGRQYAQAMPVPETIGIDDERQD